VGLAAESKDERRGHELSFFGGNLPVDKRGGGLSGKGVMRIGPAYAAGWSSALRPRCSSDSASRARGVISVLKLLAE
jgi:hypothetical protein